VYAAQNSAHFSTVMPSTSYISASFRARIPTDSAWQPTNSKLPAVGTWVVEGVEVVVEVVEVEVSVVEVEVSVVDVVVSVVVVDVDVVVVVSVVEVVELEVVVVDVVDDPDGGGSTVPHEAGN
jgi:hypothetical protein